MAISICLMICSYTSINVRVKYQTLEENRRAEEEMKESCTCSLNIIFKKYMAISICLMIWSYTSINVRVKYQILEENRRAVEEMKESCTCSLNIFFKK